MFRGFFSSRHFQQLIREGKLLKERVYLFSLILHFIIIPLLFFSFFWLYLYKNTNLQTMVLPINFTILSLSSAIFYIIFSQTSFNIFTELFNYQEDKYLVNVQKSLFRFSNSLLLIILLPLIWYVHLPQLLIYIYLPIFTILLINFLYRVNLNIPSMKRVQFFIYFCTFEFLPLIIAATYLLSINKPI